MAEQDEIGPKLPLIACLFAAMQLHQTSHSCIARHFVRLLIDVQTLPTLEQSWLKQFMRDKRSFGENSINRIAPVLTPFSRPEDLR
jgi:hypothetical protein